MPRLCREIAASQPRYRNRSLPDSIRDRFPLFPITVNAGNVNSGRVLIVSDDWEVGNPQVDENTRQS